jgi:hypothetical protein
LVEWIILKCWHFKFVLFDQVLELLSTFYDSGIMNRWKAVSCLGAIASEVWKHFYYLNTDKMSVIML